MLNIEHVKEIASTCHMMVWGKGCWKQQNGDCKQLSRGHGSLDHRKTHLCCRIQPSTTASLYPARACQAYDKSATVSIVPNISSSYMFEGEKDNQRWKTVGCLYLQLMLQIQTTKQKDIYTACTLELATSGAIQISNKAWKYHPEHKRRRNDTEVSSFKLAVRSILCSNCLKWCCKKAKCTLWTNDWIFL